MVPFPILSQGDDAHENDRCQLRRIVALPLDQRLGDWRRRCWPFCSPRQLEAAEWNSGIPWPEVPVVDPGPVGGPPADAIVLFDGKDLSQWDGGDKWIVEDGVATGAVADIRTKQPFGDCQLHVEWATPAKVVSSGQGRGNSGVYLDGSL